MSEATVPLNPPKQEQTAPTVVFPEQSLLDGREYIPAAGTDVQATWRKFGWVPPSAQKGVKA